MEECGWVLIYRDGCMLPDPTDSPTVSRVCDGRGFWEGVVAPECISQAVQGLQQQVCFCTTSNLMLPVCVCTHVCVCIEIT